VKLAAARAVLAPLIAPGATIESVEASSGVPDQPWGDEETVRGARTRASAALAASGADLAVAFEGGVVSEDDGALRTCAWAAVVDRAGHEAVGGSLAMPLPPAVAAMVRAGAELGLAMDALTEGHNTKQKLGAVGILTAGLLDRQRAYEVILTYALTRWLAAEYWKDRG
jgi:inosine/xanthosine triphosphatase